MVKPIVRHTRPSAWSDAVDMWILAEETSVGFAPFRVALDPNGKRVA
jgi:hypothetical protein